MSNIVWLASYPKSGNTWVRFIIANLLYGTMARSGDVHRLIPDIHKGITAAHLIGAKTTFIKSHLDYFDAMPLREDTVGAIYVVRNPLDVMASACNYIALRRWTELDGGGEDLWRALQQSVIKDFLETGRPAQFATAGRGTWAKHVVSWHRKDLPFPRLTIRFEDLKTDPRGQVFRIRKAIGVKRSEDQIDAALAASSFDSLRRMEEREVAAGQPGFFAIETPKTAFSQGRRFMNKGTTGTYRDILTDDQIAAAKRQFGPLMRMLRYDVD